MCLLETSWQNKFDENFFECMNILNCHLYTSIASNLKYTP